MVDGETTQAERAAEIRVGIEATLPPELLEKIRYHVVGHKRSLTKVVIRSRLREDATGGRAVEDS